MSASNTKTRMGTGQVVRLLEAAALSNGNDEFLLAKAEVQRLENIETLCKRVFRGIPTVQNPYPYKSTDDMIREFQADSKKLLEALYHVG